MPSSSIRAALPSRCRSGPCRQWSDLDEFPTTRAWGVGARDGTRDSRMRPGNLRHCRRWRRVSRRRHGCGVSWRVLAWHARGWRLGRRTGVLALIHGPISPSREPLLTIRRTRPAADRSVRHRLMYGHSHLLSRAAVRVLGIPSPSRWYNCLSRRFARSFRVGRTPHSAVRPPRHAEARTMRKYLTEFIGAFFLVLTIGLTVLSETPLAPWQSGHH